MAKHDTVIAEMYLSGRSLQETSTVIGKPVNYVGYRRSVMLKNGSLCRISKRENHRPCDYRVKTGSFVKAFETDLTQEQRDWVVSNLRGDMTIADLFVRLVQQDSRR